MYKAKHKGKTVAVKVLKPPKDQREHFLKEVDVLAKINSEYEQGKGRGQKGTSSLFFVGLW